MKETLKNFTDNISTYLKFISFINNKTFLYKNIYTSCTILNKYSVVLAA